MSRIIIDIKDGISPSTALLLVERVIREGRVSNYGKSYCYVTSFQVGEDNIIVAINPYRKSDCFVVHKVKRDPEIEESKS